MYVIYFIFRAARNSGTNYKLSGRRGGLRYRLTLTQGWVLSMCSGVKEMEGRRLEEW